MCRAWTVIALLPLFACSGGGRTIDQTACGTSIGAIVGTKIQVSLSSTYWTFQPTSNETILKQDGMTKVTPSGNCVPGGGCGTANATFDALAVGQATISATRTSCGEAVGCTAAQGSGVCDITVTISQ